MEEFRVACEHKRIKSVNCVIFCMDCGARLEVVSATRTSSVTANAVPPSPEGKAEKTKRTAKKKAEA